MLGTSWKHDVQTASAHNVGHTGPNVPKLVVDPFVDLSGTERSAIIARGLTDEVIGQLAKFKEIVVIAGRSPSVSSEVPTLVNARLPYVLEGRVRVEGEKLRISARLLDRTDGSVIWTNHYDKIVQVRNVLELEADIAQGVATALAQPYGIIFKRMPLACHSRRPMTGRHMHAHWPIMAIEPDSSRVRIPLFRVASNGPSSNSLAMRPLGHFYLLHISMSSVSDTA